MDAGPVVDRDGSMSTSLVGRTVSSEEEAYKLYNDYAEELGFSVRRGRYRYLFKTKEVREKDFLCACSGLKVDQKLSNPVSYKRKSFRSDCLAMIRFSVVNDSWEVIHHVTTHNHYLASSEEVQYLRSHRNITPEKASVIDTLKQSGFRTFEVYNYVSEDANGPCNVGYTKRDCYNYVNNQRITLIEAGDAQSLIDSFKKKQKDDPSFFFTEQIDQEGRLTNFFWCDGMSRLDYDSFGDVVVFDTTYRTNRYNLICAPFVGVNHHWKNVMFGCAFLLDEKTESFVWLFQSFLDAMGDRPPKTIITDQDQAMSKAIEIVFPSTVHRLCLWHIARNYPEHLGRLNGEPGFMKMFSKCLYRTTSEDEFENTWKEMIDKFNCQEHTWLTSFYKIKHKWCRGINKGVFSGDIKSSQRSESTNNVLNGIASATTGLLEFLNGYFKLVERWRENEKQDQFDNRLCHPTRVEESSGILRHAAEVYTICIYQLFEKEYLKVLGTKWKEVEISGQKKTYEMKQEHPNVVDEYVDVECNAGCGNELSGPTVFTVLYDGVEENVACICKKFESLGLLCCHALKVLNLNQYQKIPNQYILQRWTRDAKVNENRRTGNTTNGENNNPAEQTDLTFRNRFLRLCYNVALKSTGRPNVRAILDSAMKKLTDNVDDEIFGLVVSDGTARNVNEVADLANDLIRRKDPKVSRRKGVHNNRIRGHIEKGKGKGKGSKKSQKTGKWQKQSRGANLNDAVEEDGGGDDPPTYTDVGQNMHLRGVGTVLPTMMPLHIPSPDNVSSVFPHPNFVSLLQGMHHPAYFPHQATQ